MKLIERFEVKSLVYCFAIIEIAIALIIETWPMQSLGFYGVLIKNPATFAIYLLFSGIIIMFAESVNIRKSLKTLLYSFSITPIVYMAVKIALAGQAAEAIIYFAAAVLGAIGLLAQFYEIKDSSQEKIEAMDWFAMAICLFGGIIVLTETYIFRACPLKPAYFCPGISMLFIACTILYVIILARAISNRYNFWLKFSISVFLLAVCSMLYKSEATLNIAGLSTIALFIILCEFDKLNRAKEKNLVLTSEQIEDEGFEKAIEVSIWLVMIAVIILIMFTSVLAAYSKPLLYSVCLGAVIFEIIWHHYFPLKYQGKRKLKLEAIFDFIVICLVVYVTGGVNSNFWFLFFFSLFTSVVILDSFWLTALLYVSITIFFGVLLVISKVGIGSNYDTFIAVLKILGLGLMGYYYHSINDRIQTKNSEVSLLNIQLNQRIEEVTTKDSILRERTQAFEKSNKELLGTRSAMLNVLEDVEEEKRLAAEERDKLKIILESIGDIVFAFDGDMRIIVFNKAAENFFGLKESNVLGKSVNKYVFIGPEKCETKKECESIGMLTKVFNYKKVVDIPKNSIVFITPNSINKLRTETKAPVIGSVAPILSHQKEILGAIVVLKNMTKEYEMEKMKSSFVSVASHQLRTPLSAIKWFMELILGGDAGKINEEQKDYLKQAYESNERMIKLVNDLLNVSRIEEGRVKLEPKMFNLIEVFKSVIKEQDLIAQASNKVINFSPSSALLEVYADPQKIREVITNLLSNAIKYTKGKGKVSINIAKKGEDILCSIKDQGIGITRENKEKVFSKFFRADEAVSLQTEGTGLGLFIAKAIIEASNGEIWFESAEGKGTTFYFTLPTKMKVSKEKAGSKLEKKLGV